jgi:hypothetical protein
VRDLSLSHLSDAVLLRNLSALVVLDRRTTADLLAHLAEVDARQLYAEAGYSSMFAYCVRELHLSENAAGKRIYAARAVRKFPALLGALDQGKIHLTALCLLAPHVTENNKETLIEGASHKGKAEVEAWLVANSITPAVPIQPCTIKPIVARASETSMPTVPSMFDAPPVSADDERARADVGVSSNALQHVPEHVEVSPNLSSRPEHVDIRRSQPPPAPEHYRMQVVIPKGTHDKLRHAQALLSHAVPSGDVVKVLDRALDLLITHLERRKIGAREGRTTETPRRTRAMAKHYVPAHVRRAVWDRDHGQCTFVSAGGNRCSARTLLEYDHAQPVARGGTSTVANVRLRCRAHNQCEARRAFGSGFMARKRLGGGHSMEHESGT